MHIISNWVLPVFAFGTISILCLIWSLDRNPVCIDLLKLSYQYPCFGMSKTCLNPVVMVIFITFSSTILAFLLLRRAMNASLSPGSLLSQAVVRPVSIRRTFSCDLIRSTVYFALTWTFCIWNILLGLVFYIKSNLTSGWKAEIYCPLWRFLLLLNLFI